MTKEISYYAKVSDSGTLEGLPTKKFRNEMARLFKGESVEITVHKKKKHRSVQQNKYYWLLMSILSDHTGFTKSECHSLLKRKFLTVEKASDKTGTVYEYTRSTTELSTVEFLEYVDSVCQWASEEFGIVLPEPEEQLDAFTHNFQNS